MPLMHCPCMHQKFEDLGLKIGRRDNHMSANLVMSVFCAFKLGKYNMHNFVERLGQSQDCCGEGSGSAHLAETCSTHFERWCSLLLKFLLHQLNMEPSK